MSTLTAQLLLQTWEQAQSEDPLRRSLALLRAAWPDVDPNAWRRLPVGSREACLLALQESLFGSEIDAQVACPACGADLEVSCGTGDLRSAMKAAADGPCTLHCDGYVLAYRLPCSEDLLEVAAAQDATLDAAVLRLLERCVLDARRGAAPTPVSELPESLVDRLQREMAERDPGADVRVALVCADCGHRFERPFHIGAYLWDELDDWAQRTLSEVHVLASAYGWSEAEILALGAMRRRHYIALVQP